MRRLPELDGLRGIAILSVIAHHYVIGPTKIAGGGWLEIFMVPAQLLWTGVDLFFVLSGYLLGTILIANRDAPSYFRPFYIRRVLRIFPLYLILLALCYAFDGDFWSAPRPSLLQYLTLTQNFWMVTAGSLGVATLAVTWSLAVEEQFYLVLPALVRFVSQKWLWLALAICMALSPLLRAGLYLQYGDTANLAVHMLLFTRLDTLMLGVLIAWAQHRNVAIPDRFLQIAWFAAGVGMLVFAWKIRLGQPGLALATLCYPVVAVFYGATLLIALRGGGRFLRSKALVYTGVISYGLYLLHQPVNMLFRGDDRSIRSWSDAFITLAVFAIVYLVATASWEFFEKKFVEYGHRYRYGTTQDARRVVPRAEVPHESAG